MSTTQASLADLFAAHHDAILRYVRSRAPEAAEDLVADVFAVAVRRADAIPAGAEQAWLFGVAKNVLREHYREQRRDAQLVAELGPQTPNSIPGPEPITIGAAFDQLPQTERAVLALTGLEGLSSAEAAERLGMSAGSTRNAMVRARRNLATQLVGFGLLCGLAVFAVLLGRRDRSATDAPQIARALVQQLRTAGEVSAVAQTSGTGGSGRVTFHVDRAAQRQSFGLGEGVRASGPVGGELHATGTAGTPKAKVDEVVRARTPVVTALRTITEGQVAALIADGAAGRAKLSTSGAGTALRTTVEGDVTAFGGKRLALRVALTGTPATLRRVQARAAGSSAPWTTLDVDRWTLGGAPTPAPTAAPTSSPAASPRPTATPMADKAASRAPKLSAKQAAVNREVVATTPKYEGDTGAVRYTEQRTRLPGLGTSMLERRWVEIGGGHRSHQLMLEFDERGRPAGGRELWWDDRLSVIVPLTKRGERLTPSVAVSCVGVFNPTPNLLGVDYQRMLGGTLTPGSKIRGRASLFAIDTSDPAVTYSVWFDAERRVPLRYVISIEQQPPAYRRHVTDVLAFQDRRAGGSAADLEPVLPKRYKLQDLRKNCPGDVPAATTPGAAPTTPETASAPAIAGP